MPELNKDTLPVEPVVEQDLELDEQGVASGDEETGQGKAAQSLTEDKILELVKKALDEREPAIINKAYREAQSLTDKTAQRLQERIEQLKGVGIEVNDEQAYKLRQQISNELTQEQGQVEQPKPDAIQPTGDPVVDYIRREQMKLIEKYGVAIEQSDPQFKLINWDRPPTEGFDFLREYEEQLKDKVAQKQTEDGDSESDEDESAMVLSDSRNGRVPSGTGNLSSLDLISRGYKDSAKRNKNRRY